MKQKLHLQACCIILLVCNLGGFSHAQELASLEGITKEGNAKKQSQVKSLNDALAPKMGGLGLEAEQQLMEDAAITVQGQVTSQANGETIPGVNILIKGEATGTVTDIDGNYTVNAPEDGILVFSSIGYITQEVPINGRSIIDVALAEDVQGLEEVVVVGYGQQQRRDITGSISSVKGSDFEGEVMSSLVQGLQGEAAGVRVVEGSGQPGGRTIIRIRGQNSVMGGGDPLYVLDGYPIQSGDDGNTSMISTINPDDIESIEVLKDASATAIYGARGSNGVILITTKHGRSNQQLVDFKSSVGLSEVIKKIDMMDSRQFVEIANERAINDGESIPFPDVDAASSINTNWQDEIFRTALTQNHSLSFSGGSEQTQYYVSGSFLEQEGSIIGSDFSRGSLRVNLDQQVSERFSLSSQIYASHSEANRSQTETSGGILFSALGMPPINAPRDEDGNYTPGDVLLGYPFSPSSGDNPILEGLERLNKLKSSRLLGNIRASYDLYNDFSMEVMVGMDQINNIHDEYSSRLLRGVPDGTGSERRTEIADYVIEGMLKYNRIFGEHQVNATGGFTWQSEASRFLSASASGFVTDDFQNSNLGAGERFDAPNSGITESNIVSFLGRANYIFKDRYLFTLSGRRDGSSRFGEQHKWGFFPSAAIGWRLSNEDFIKQVEQISDLKLRFSWGKSGNQAISPYQSLQRFSPQTLAFGNTSMIGFAPANLGNPDLKWETTEQFNAGLDLGLMNQRLRMSFDLYHKNTSNLLARVNLPPSSGFATTLQNIGSMENQGVELDLAYDLLRDTDFLWVLSLNLSTNRNEVTDLARGADIIAPTINILGSGNIVRVGEPLSAFYGLEEDGLTEDGFINYVDQNNDGDINSEDRVILGDPYPDFVFGFSTAIEYKNFDLKVSIQGEQGKELWNNNIYFMGSSFFRGMNSVAEAVNRWTPNNPRTDAPYPRATTSLNMQPSDRFVEDASYLRLKNIQLGYNLPSGRLPVRSARIFVSAQNVLTFTNYSWYDPDVNAFASGDLRVGVDINTFPVSKTVMLGINIGL